MTFIFKEKKFLKTKKNNKVQLLNKETLSGSHPIFTFLVKESPKNKNFNVISYIFAESKKIEILSKDIMSAFVNGTILDGRFLEKECEEATHIITGYYDLIQEKWFETATTKLDKPNNEKQIFDEIYNNYEKCYADFFKNKELFLHNLDVSTKKGLPFLGFEELENNLELKEVYQFILNLFDKKTNKINFMELIAYLENKKVPLMSNSGFAKNATNLTVLLGVMYARDVFQKGYLNIHTSEIYYATDLIELGDEFDFKNLTETSLYSKRFMASMMQD